MDAIFQPPKSKTANLGKIDYLGKSQVTVFTSCCKNVSINHCVIHYSSKQLTVCSFSQVVVDTATYETMETPLHLVNYL